MYLLTRAVPLPTGPWEGVWPLAWAQLSQQYFFLTKNTRQVRAVGAAHVAEHVKLSGRIVEANSDILHNRLAHFQQSR